MPQCNKLTAIVNQADTVTAPAVTGKPEALREAAAKLDQVSASLKAVEVEDKQLQSLRSSFILMYEEIGVLFRNTAIAIAKQDRPAVESYLKSLKEASTQDRVLVQKINAYCSAK